MSKYGNKKIQTPDGEFDSKREYKRWQELKLLARAGKIHDLMRQVSFELIPTQHERVEKYSKKTGKRLKDGVRCLEKACFYIADFVYWDGDTMVVEDAKGHRTEAYIIKRKLMLKVHGIKIQEV